MTTEISSPPSTPATSIPASPRNKNRWVWAVIFIIGVIVAWLAGSTHKPAEPAPQVISELTYWPDITHSSSWRNSREQVGKENAVLYMLVRNFEIHEALKSIRQIEDRFNRKYHYPWVFLNDEEFTEEFVKLTSGMVSGQVEYGFVESKDWDVPAHINKTHMQECMDDMIQNDVIYGGSLSYRNMCRYNSGKFIWHPSLLKYDWYWRVEPGIKFFCDQNYDPFTFLRENNKVYGFVITIQDVPETIPTLWRTAIDFFENKHPEYLAPDNGLKFLTDFRSYHANSYFKKGIDGYNLCHFWSNFEIGSFAFFRSKGYTDYFNHLDASGGFYYERWGDAPVHTIGLMLLANKTQIHHFGDMGYYHLPFWRCPHNEEAYTSGRCLCPDAASENVDFYGWSCLPSFLHHAGHQHLFNFSQEPRFN